MKSRVYKKPWMGETHQSHYGWAQEHNKQAAQKLTLESQQITLFFKRHKNWNWNKYLEPVESSEIIH